MSAVDEYLRSLDGPVRAVFQRIRDVATTEVPDAEQGTSYGLAALKYRGKPLLGFRATKQHLSIFPFSSGVVDAVRDKLAGFHLSKGTVRFTVDRPLPDEVVREMVRLRIAEITGTG